MTRLLKKQTIDELKVRFQATQHPARVFAAAVFLCAVFSLLIGFNRSPRLYPVDYGQYKEVLEQCGLTWTAEDLAQGDLQYVRPITTFAWTRFAWSNLLTPKAGGSIVYLIALVRLWAKPLGLPFMVDSLAFVSAALLCVSVTILALALRRLFPRVWYVPVALFCAIAMDGNFCAIFRGLYPEGPAIVFSMLFAALSLYAFSLPEEKRRKWLPPALLSSLLALKSFTGLIVFLPLCLAVDLYLVCSCWRYLAQKLALAAILAVLLVTGFGSAVRQAGQDPDYFSNASVYESVFNTMLPAADKPKSLLTKFGLDESYARDIGRSFYEPEEDYAHNPRDKEEAEKLFSLVTPENTVSTYLSHPDLLFKVIAEIPSALSRGFENGRNRQLVPESTGFSASRTEGGILAFLWKLLPHSYVLFLVCQLTFCLIGILLCVRRRNPRWAGLSLYSLCAALYLPFTVMLNGYGQYQQYILLQALMEMALWAEGLSFALYLAPGFFQWITHYTFDPFLAPEERLLPYAEGKRFGRVRGFLKTGYIYLAGSQKRIVLTTAVAACALLAVTFLPADHPVTVNNGDFGRMMEQMDITWPGYIFFDSAAQANRRGIEEYEYVRSFQPVKLTPMKPTYSLYLFASIVRLLTQPFGLPFSTMLLSWVMGLVSVACVVSLVRDLYPLLKQWTLLAAALLCAMAFSETYLVWYNSLYGEGCILAGLLMTVACAVHLCVLPNKRGFTQYFWLAGLCLSLYVLVCSKAQMLLAVPGAAALLIILWACHLPYRYDLQAVHGAICLALCLALVFVAVGVYQTDRTTDSVSQKHTMWQAYFYGIFMIADDPIQEMEYLGVDTAMAPDIGKFVRFDNESDYVYAPLSEEAEKAFYDHVSMFTIVEWYVTHPLKLFSMLDHAAKESKELYTGFRVYYGQDYSAEDHDPVNGRNLWPAWRTYLTPGSFLGYVLLYGALLAFLIWRIARKGTSAEIRKLCAVPLFLLLTGVLQFPLSVMGNGFADNQKQLFCFALCHDLLLIGALTLGLRYLSSLTLKLNRIKIREWMSAARDRAKSAFAYVKTQGQKLRNISQN